MDGRVIGSVIIGECNYWGVIQALTGDLDRKLCINMHSHMWYIYMYIYTYIHIPESTRKIFRTQLKITRTNKKLKNVSARFGNGRP